MQIFSACTAMNLMTAAGSWSGYDNLFWLLTYRWKKYQLP
jgi:hypothetical protein